MADGPGEPVVDADAADARIVDTEVVEAEVVESGAGRSEESRPVVESELRDAPAAAAVEDAVTAPVPSVNAGEAANFDEPGSYGEPGSVEAELPTNGEYVDESAGWTRRVARYFGFGADK